MKTCALAVIACLALATPLSAQPAEPIVAMTEPGAVALALRGEGYRAKITRNEQGRPTISSGAGGFVFDIVFFGCDGDGECSGVLFSAGFDLDGGVGLETMNTWNRSRLVGRGFTDRDCDPFVDHYVTADQMMSQQGFTDLLGEWETALADFADFIGLTDDSPRAAVAGCGPGTDAI